MKPEAEVVAVVGPVSQYGSGHLRRMELLQYQLALYGINMSILIDDTGWLDIPYSAKVVLLDRRDTAFPPASLRRRDRLLISIDNLGHGAAQAKLRYAALPDVTMSPRETKAALRNVILPPDILCHRNLCDRAVIWRFRFGLPQADLVLHPYRERLPRERFLKNLHRAQTVACYYGQTLFEALYLGKKILLYDISPLHRRLADNFFQTWRGLAYPRLYFDGRGLERLAQFIRQAVHAG